MSTKTDNGKGSKVDATATKDTLKGVAALATVKKDEQPKVELPPLPPNPLAERLKRVNEANKLIEKRKTVSEMLEDVNEFDTEFKGEKESLILVSATGTKLQVHKSDTVKKFLGILKNDCELALADVETNIVNATI